MNRIGREHDPLHIEHSLIGADVLICVRFSERVLWVEALAVIRVLVHLRG